MISILCRTSFLMPLLIADLSMASTLSSKVKASMSSKTSLDDAKAKSVISNVIMEKESFLTDTQTIKLNVKNSCCSTAFLSQEGHIIVSTTVQEQDTSYVLMIDVKDCKQLWGGEGYKLANSRSLFDQFVAAHKLNQIYAMGDGQVQIEDKCLKGSYLPIQCSWLYHNNIIVEESGKTLYGIELLKPIREKNFVNAPFFCGFDGGYHSFKTTVEPEVPNVFNVKKNIVFVFDKPASIITTDLEDLEKLSHLEGGTRRRWYQATGLLPVDAKELQVSNQVLSSDAKLGQAVSQIDEMILNEGGSK